MKIRKTSIIKAVIINKFVATIQRLFILRIKIDEQVNNWLQVQRLPAYYLLKTSYRSKFWTLVEIVEFLFKK